MLTLLAATLISAADVQLEESDDDERAHHELAFLVDGGLSAGLPVAAWVGGAVRYEYRFDSGFFLGAQGGLAGGLGMLDPRANFLAGVHLIDARHVDWSLMLYAGWPLIGVQSRFEVLPLRFRHFEASLGLRASAEILWNVEGDVFAKLAVPVGGWVPSVRVAFEAGIGVRSGAHLGPSVALQLARKF